MHEPITGAEAIVSQLVSAGIEMVFGIPGKYSTPLYEAIRATPSITTITVRHEQGAGFMADGYARATGRPAALLLLPGCGVTNALTALGEAYWDSSPVLVLATQVDTTMIDRGLGLLHELSGQFEVVASVCKASVRIGSASAIAEKFQTALSALFSGRPRPVQVEIPLDVQLAPASEEVRELDVDRRPPADSPIRSVAQMLTASSRPVIYAGGGVTASGAHAELQSLAETFQAPVITTGMGVGSIPGDHPLWCGVAWEAAADLRPVIAASDMFLAVGTRFNEGMTYGWDLPLPAASARIDIDPDPPVAGLFEISTFVQSDARLALRQILDIVGPEPRRRAPAGELREALSSARDRHREKVGRTGPWMDALRAVVPRDGIISADMTLFWADMIGCFPFFEPRTSLFPWGYGTLGFGLPAAIGAKLGRPERAVVAIVGDGAMLFTGTELATAVQYGLSLPIIVANNNSYGMIQMQQRAAFGTDVAVELHNPDFVAFSRSFGAAGAHAATPGELAEELQAALDRPTPTVIEVPWGITFDGSPAQGQ